MRTLCDGDFAPTLCSNFRDFRASTTNNTAYHICGNRDILSTNLRWVDGFARLTAGSGRLVGEVSAIAGSERVRTATIVIGGPTEGGIIRGGRGGRSSSSTTVGDDNGTARGSETDGRVVQDCSNATFPIVDTAFSDFPDCGDDGLDAALNFDDSFGGLGEHFLGRDHTGSRDVLDVLDFEAASTNDCAHEIVRDEETDRGMRVGGGSDGIGIGRRVDRVGKESLCNQSVCLEN